MMMRLPEGPARAMEQTVLRRWERALDDADQTGVAELRRLRDRAAVLRDRLDCLVHLADGRLSRPDAMPAGLQRPLHGDWVWRPPLWSGPFRPVGLAGIASGTSVGDAETVFHDCSASEIAFRQVRNPAAGEGASFGLRLEVFRFDGSFLSLAIDLPPAGVAGIERRHLVGLSLELETERRMELFGRLNIRHGPNTEQVVREFPMDADRMSVDFDLAYTELDEKRVERAWLDLIFERPEMNRITLRDLVLSRRPRAEL